MSWTGERYYHSHKKEEQIHPVAFASRALSPQEANYSITDLETLVVAWAVTYFHISVWPFGDCLHRPHSHEGHLGDPQPKWKACKVVDQGLREGNQRIQDHLPTWQSQPQRRCSVTQPSLTRSKRRHHTDRSPSYTGRQFRGQSAQRPCYKPSPMLVHCLVQIHSPKSSGKTPTSWRSFDSWRRESSLQTRNEHARLLYKVLFSL